MDQERKRCDLKLAGPRVPVASIESSIDGVLFEFSRRDGAVRRW